MGIALLLLIASLLIAGLAHGIAINRQFFQIKQQPGLHFFDIKTILIIVISFLALSKLIPIWTFDLFTEKFNILNKFFSEPTLKMMSFTLSSLINIYLIYLIAFTQNPNALIETIGLKKEKFFKDVKNGLFGFILAISTVTSIGILLQLITFWLFGESGNEQSIITYLKSHQDSIGVKLLGFVNIVFLAPALEEIIFRGFIQRSLKKHLSPWRSIIFTSISFALVHFSAEQGLGNIALLGCIFFLSCYLGFIYEKTSSLVSPIVLHMLFNLDGIARIFLTS